MWAKGRLKFCTRSSIEGKDQTTYKKLVKLKPFLKKSKSMKRSSVVKKMKGKIYEKLSLMFYK
jgi:hypothetical protein